MVSLTPPHRLGTHVETFGATCVRMIMLVQDVPNPEMFVGGASNAYRETPQNTQDPFTSWTEGAQNVIWERRPMLLVPIPNEASWVQDDFGVMPPATPTREVDSPAAPPQTNNGANRKRPISSTTMVDSAEQTAAPSLREQPAAPTPPPLPTAQQQQISEAGSVLAKFYPANGAPLPKLHDVVEVIGVVTHTPADFTNMLDDPSFASASPAYPPPSQLPRLQVLHYRTLEPVQRISRSVVEAPVQDVRSLLLASLTSEAFAGDALAAEYMLLQLLSRVYARVGDRPLGKLSLNFTRCTEITASSIVTCVSGLCAYAGGVRLTQLAAADAPSLVPKKDYETERLMRGALQLPASSVLVIDETDVVEGMQFGEVGVKNLSALQAVATKASLPIDFTFYETACPLDVSVISVSRGKSLLRDTFDAAVPVQPDAAAAAAAASVVSAAVAGAVDALRLAVLKARTCGDASIPASEAAALALETAVVSHKNALAQAGVDVTQEHLHHALTLARLLAISYGDAEVSAAHVNRASELEVAREKRLIAA